MTFIVLLLIFLSLCQSSFGSGELAILTIILRTFLVGDKFNFWLAFGVGLFISFLQNLPLGSLSLLYISIVMIVQILRSTSLASHWLFIFPFSLSLLILSMFLQSSIFRYSPQIQQLILPVIIFIPLYLFLRFWEDRFIPKKELRLKIGR